jgi:large subunit ribosomal protein L4e
VLSARGTRFYRVAAFVSNVRGGRKAHPPLAEKNITERINKKERRKAIRSAIAATRFNGYPLIIEDKLEKINKTKEVNNLLNNLKLTDRIEKSKDKKVRQGRGKRRGRKYKRKRSILFVVSKPCDLSNSSKNVAGVDISSVKNLNVSLLAPGGNPGRVTIWSKAAIDELNNGNLFL